ncbi:MAG: alpha/beta hydrolase, partial [Hyphomonadaceae bacterium]
MKPVLLTMVITCLSNLAIAQPANFPSIPLWQDGVPGFEANAHIPERAGDWWVRDIHNPSLTVFEPSETAPDTRTAVIIVPGGGHKDLVFNSEGVKPARYLQELGITAFALKYRLARE